jgi:hypothetical protein
MNHLRLSPMSNPPDHKHVRVRPEYGRKGPSGPGEPACADAIFTQAAADCRAHPRSPGSHVHAGPVETFDPMADTLIAARARSTGGRYFQAGPRCRNSKSPRCKA